MQTNATLRPMGATVPRDDRRLLNATLDLMAAKAPGYDFQDLRATRDPPNTYRARMYR